MRFLSVSLLFPIITACGAPLQSHIEDDPRAQVSTANVSSSAIHSARGWAGPVEFVLSQETPERLVTAVRKAARTWNDAVGRDVLIYKGRVATAKRVSLYDSLGDDTTVIYFEKSWIASTAKPQTTLATTIWENEEASHESIVKGDIILNAEEYLFQDSMTKALEPGREVDMVDTETVLLHEMGHLLGLDHVNSTEDADSVMLAHTFIGPKFHKRVLSSGDKDNIQSIYNAE